MPRLTRTERMPINLWDGFFTDLRKKAEYALISLTGGQKDNAITRECTAEFLTDSVAEVKAYAKELQEQLREEYTGSDENITFEITEKGTATAEVLHPTSQEKIVFYLQNVPFGIQKMSGTIKGLVETSSNIGILRLDRDELFASSSVRSSVDAACSALSDKIEYLTEFLVVTMKYRVHTRMGVQKGISITR